MIRRNAFPALLPLTVLSWPTLVVAQTAGAPQVEMVAASQLDAAVRRDIVAKLSEALRERYIFPDVGERAAARITKALETGEYNGLTNRGAFIQRLSADVQAIARDKHLNIMSPGSGPPPGKAPSAMPLAEAGITRADKLADGIGYLEVVGFPPPDAFKPVLDRAMSGLKGSRALIIDVRRNGGGSPDSVAYLVSYLVEPGRPINTIVSRTPNTKEFTRKTSSSVPTPVSFSDVPVYVLASKNTFSGGEEFAYDVQAFKRGTLIGEVTGGGANPTGPVALGHGVMASIPWGRAENPITKANWEGHGVQPDLAVPASEALKTALEKLGHKPVTEVEAASVNRVFSPRTTPLAGYEPAIRQLVSGIVSGKPDYSSMVPQFAEVTRSQLDGLRGALSSLGELRSVKFRGPSPMGGDEFDVTFANGVKRMAIVLDPEGKIVGAMIQ